MEEQTYLTSEGPLCGVSVGTLGILLGDGVLLVALAGAVGTYPETDKNMQLRTSSKGKGANVFKLKKNENTLTKFFIVDRPKVSSYNSHSGHSLVEQGRPSGSSGQAHTKLLVFAKQR